VQTLAVAALMSLCSMWGVPLWAQGAASRLELLEALGSAAATFSRTAPGLGASELLVQRGRVASVDVLKGSFSPASGREIKKMKVRLPEQYASHRVSSAWGLSAAGPIHEVRTIRTLDDNPVEATRAARHALTLGLQTPDDDTKKKLLEDLEDGTLQGAVADFVPLMLLFTEGRQARITRSVMPGQNKIDGEPMLVLRYKQVAGDEAFTEFRDRSGKRYPAEGDIWFRQSGLLPLRITLSTEEVLSVRYILRNEAEVSYAPRKFGLAPATVIHRQFLNQDLLVENKFTYSDYTGPVAIP
jgi:hypothetical protein